MRRAFAHGGAWYDVSPRKLPVVLFWEFLSLALDTATDKQIAGMAMAKMGLRYFWMWPQ